MILGAHLARPWNQRVPRARARAGLPQRGRTQRSRRSSKDDPRSPSRTSLEKLHFQCLASCSPGRRGCSCALARRVEQSLGTPRPLQGIRRQMLGMVGARGAHVYLRQEKGNHLFRFPVCVLNGSMGVVRVPGTTHSIYQKMVPGTRNRYPELIHPSKWSLPPPSSLLYGGIASVAKVRQGRPFRGSRVSSCSFRVGLGSARRLPGCKLVLRGAGRVVTVSHMQTKKERAGKGEKKASRPKVENSKVP